MHNEWLNKRVKISLKKDNWYYRGLVISVGTDYIVIKDIRDKTVYIRLEEIVSIEESDK